MYMLLTRQVMLFGAHFRSPHTPMKVPSPRYSGERVRERGFHVPGRPQIMMSPCAVADGTRSVPTTFPESCPAI